MEKDELAAKLALIKFTADDLTDHLDAAFKDKTKAISRLVDDLAVRHSVVTLVDASKAVLERLPNG